MSQHNKRWCWLVYTILIYLYSSNYWCWTNSELSRQVDLLRGLILSMLQFAIVWVSLNQESTIFFWFSQYIQVWSLSRWRHFTNGSEMGAANLDSWGPRETAIKHYKFYNNSLFEKHHNLVSLLRGYMHRIYVILWA